MSAEIEFKLTSIAKTDLASLLDGETVEVAKAYITNAQSGEDIPYVSGLSGTIVFSGVVHGEVLFEKNDVIYTQEEWAEMPSGTIPDTGILHVEFFDDSESYYSGKTVAITYKKELEERIFCLATVGNPADDLVVKQFSPLSFTLDLNFDNVNSVSFENIDLSFPPATETRLGSVRIANINEVTSGIGTGVVTSQNLNSKLTNYVDINTTQTITGTKTFSSINVTNTLSGTATSANQLVDTSNNVFLKTINSGGIKYLIPESDVTVELGDTTHRFNMIMSKYIGGPFVPIHELYTTTCMCGTMYSNSVGTPSSRTTNIYATNIYATSIGNSSNLVTNIYADKLNGCLPTQTNENTGFTFPRGTIFLAIVEPKDLSINPININGGTSYDLSDPDDLTNIPFKIYEAVSCDENIANIGGMFKKGRELTTIGIKIIFLCGISASDYVNTNYLLALVMIV